MFKAFNYISRKKDPQVLALTNTTTKIFVISLSLCLLRLDSPDFNTTRVKGTGSRVSQKNYIIAPRAGIPNASPRANA